MNKLIAMDISPFHVNVPEAELTELRRRINATRWPERETVTEPNFSQRVHRQIGPSVACHDSETRTLLGYRL
jgi:hypothetical protein